MGHTNSTANLALPQFIGTDKPTWLSDVNGAFAAIDAYAGTNDAALAITDAKADTAISDAAGAVTTATNASNTAGNAAATATAANTVAGNALTVANGINSKVGVLTDLTTTDKSTVVNAINEVNGKDAGDIAYDNTGSGLTATNVQDAIDEVAQGGGGGGLNLRSKSFTFTGETNAQAIASLKTGIDPTDISDFSYVKAWDGSIYRLSIATATTWRYSAASAVNTTATNISSLDFANEKFYVASGSTTPTDSSSATHSTGTMTLYY